MSTNLRETQFQKQIQGNVALVRFGRCMKRAGVIIAPLGFAIFRYYADLPSKLMGTWFESWLTYLPSAAWVTDVALIISIIGAILIASGYLIHYARSPYRKPSGALWRKYLELKKLEPIDYAEDQLISLIFSYGDARNPGSFIRTQTLQWLMKINPEYVKAWGTAKRTGNGTVEYADVCFYVLAPLSKVGRDDMVSRTIKKNKDLQQKHVAKSFAKSCGLYIIEVFGSSFFQKGAILYLLQKQLEKKLEQKLSNANFAVFTRPVNKFGLRQVHRFGFKNLGETEGYSYKHQIATLLTAGQVACECVKKVRESGAKILCK